MKPTPIELGRVGVWSAQFATLGAAAVREAVPEIEALGYRTLWFPESFGKEAFANAATILSAGRECIAASGIANVWARDATAMINGARTVEEAYPGRFLLGIGVSHAPSVARRGSDYRKPYATMVAYLDAMDGAAYAGPQPERDPPLLLAALGPRMLQLAADRARGAHPYFVPVEHTAIARETMGPHALLAPEQAIVLATDPDEARRVARRHTERYLRLPNYGNNLLRLGWSSEDTEEGGSDALVDAVVAWGDEDAIRDRVAAHFDAGADHVCVQVLGGPPDRFPIAELARLAPALLDL